MDSLGNYPGIPGLFVAGIFSAALSSLSTCLNAMAAIVLEDFYKPFIKNSLTEKQTSYLMKGVVFLVGFTSTALVFVVEKLGTVLQLQMSIAGVTAGPVFGVFTMVKKFFISIHVDSFLLLPLYLLIGCVDALGEKKGSSCH